MRKIIKFIILFFTYFCVFNTNSFCKQIDFSKLYKKSIDEISYSFLGKKYFDNTENKKLLISEEPPLVIDDNFDCLTYVEMVIGLNISKNYEELEKNLKKIKYKNGVVDFFDRKHFMYVDWIDGNKDILVDITKTFDKKYEKSKQILFEKKKWFKKQHEDFYNYLAKNDQLSRLEKFSDDEKVDMEYLDYKISSDHNFYKKLPNESVVFFVKNFFDQKNIIGTDLDMFHTGFLIKKENKILLRHSSFNSKKVKEENFIDYINDMSNKSKNFQGILLLKMK